MPCASVSIDAGVVVVPSRIAATDDVYRYVERLLDWSKLLDEPWIAICMSEQSSGALAEDGLVEAVSVVDAERFALAVQWHPEWKVQDNRFYLSIFKAFGEACRHYHQRR